MHVSPTQPSHCVVVVIRSLAVCFSLVSFLLRFPSTVVSHILPSRLAVEKSSLESRVNEFAITIFHVDVTTSLVDFDASLRPRRVPTTHRVRSFLRVSRSSFWSTGVPWDFLSKSITKDDNPRCSNADIYLAENISIHREEKRRISRSCKRPANSQATRKKKLNPHSIPPQYLTFIFLIFSCDTAM